MSKKIHGQCKLCLEQTDLIQSHIIPELFYKSLYEKDTHKFITMSTDTDRNISLHQKGLREHLMCSRCDGNIIGKYDTYIAKWLSQHTENTFKQSRTTLFKNEDYRLFRLFHLSLLWRFHIAESNLYNAVDLGENAEVIRKMLLNGNPGEANFYPCIMIIPHKTNKILAGGIICPGPEPTGTNEFPMCRIMAAGFLWIWFMLPDANGHPLLEAYIKPNGSMQIIKGPPKFTDKIKNDLIEINLATYKAPNAHKLNDWGFE